MNMFLLSTEYVVPGNEPFVKDRYFTNIDAAFSQAAYEVRSWPIGFGESGESRCELFNISLVVLVSKDGEYLRESDSVIPYHPDDEPDVDSELPRTEWEDPQAEWEDRNRERLGSYVRRTEWEDRPRERDSSGQRHPW